MDKVRGVFEVGGLLPGWGIVALPLEKVLKAVIVQATVHDDLDPSFILAIDDNGGWGWCYLCWVQIDGGVLQE